jgi:hypothetical protein
MNEKLKGGQKKLDVAEPKGKLTSADFKALRSKKVNEEDHEVSMANTSLESIIQSAMELKSKLGTDERNIPGWIQDHITNAENYILQASKGFHEIEPEVPEQLPYDQDSEEDASLSGIMEKILSEKKKPSAGLSKKQKSTIAKKARAGKDVGKKGKGFKDVEKKAAASGAKNPKAVAAAAMWKSVKRK